ncbi:MAG: UDP-glucose/GDP-mannose dehydrogenase family protein [Acidobacteria bacterium]|nr:UDP-glucose/GDP-mannose dehydrogenase family protein [Acidobacteriota bacterium]MBV9623754.1 UDP-glucose/GDP-mannose dehydrogenase family protein [Acidobacteriota bacterium]
MSQSISIFGLGYVGSVSAACFASMGNRVIGVDVNPGKVEMLQSGSSPIVEARMNELVSEASRSCRLHATSDATAAVLQSDISFICVGTPSLRNGKLDLTHVEKVGREIGAALKKKNTHHLVVLRSTVLPGTTESLLLPVLEAESGKRAGTDFSLCFNPEFMREGSAVADFLEPPYTILGSRDPKQLKPLRELYGKTSGRVFETTISVAEMVKYLSNAFHAVKVAFANEVGTLAKHLGVDTEAVTEIFLSDTRLNISPAYLSPGFAFGGSCLPKDLRAVTYRAKELDLRLPLLESLLPSNREHVDRALEAVLRTGKRKIAQLGLSFKAGTDDLRESPQVELVKRLLGEGCEVRVWDEDVRLGRLAGSNRQYIEEVIPHIGALLTTDLKEALANAEVVIVGTRALDSRELAEQLRPGQMVIDLVNLARSRRPTTEASYEGVCW